MNLPRLCRCRLSFVALLLALSAATRLSAADSQESELKPGDPFFAKFNPRKAPAPGVLLLQPGDRLAIVGDSITEQKLYSRIVEKPFCAQGSTDHDNSIRSGMTLVPFNAELNRFKLVVKPGRTGSERYTVTWGGHSHIYMAAQLAQGVNLADDFQVNPFSEAFAKVDAAVAAKQAYETRQIKELFHGPEGRAEADATAALTEKVRQPLAEGITKAFVPVTHTISITAM